MLALNGEKKPAKATKTVIHRFEGLLKAEYGALLALYCASSLLKDAGDGCLERGRPNQDSSVGSGSILSTHSLAFLSPPDVTESVAQAMKFLSLLLQDIQTVAVRFVFSYEELQWQAPLRTCAMTKLEIWILASKGSSMLYVMLPSCKPAFVEPPLEN